MQVGGWMKGSGTRVRRRQTVSTSVAGRRYVPTSRYEGVGRDEGVGAEGRRRAKAASTKQGHALALLSHYGITTTPNTPDTPHPSLTHSGHGTSLLAGRRYVPTTRRESAREGLRAGGQMHACMKDGGTRRNSRRSSRGVDTSLQRSLAGLGRGDGDGELAWTAGEARRRRSTAFDASLHREGYSLAGDACGGREGDGDTARRHDAARGTSIRPYNVQVVVEGTWERRKETGSKAGMVPEGGTLV
ncbi:hypothetical protein SCHPADRAFT_748488 [Schizopora paradoxa]|uniref:Uncharacterized protein n=1 Tax=Schizopora paradoxa TaxID=27342 RepID=A0A0H2R5A6_9AGAM|nr:hypothetical protein SCHPADRAFT_748488 [Schizopora paradoxa]